MKFCSYLLCCCYNSQPHKETSNTTHFTDNTYPLNPGFQYHYNRNFSVATEAKRSISVPPAKSEMHRSNRALKTRAASTSPVLIPTFHQNFESSSSNYGTNGTLQFKMSLNNVNLSHSKNTITATPQTKTEHTISIATMESQKNTLKKSTVKLCQKNRFSFAQYMREKERKKREIAVTDTHCDENNSQNSDSFSGVFPMSLASN